MDIFAFVQKIFLVVLPGVIGSYLYASLNIQKEQHYYLKFLKIVVLAVVSYVISDSLFWTIKKMFPCFAFAPVNIIYQIGAKDTTISTANMLVSCVVAIVLSCMLTKMQYENWLFKVANRLNLTKRIDNQPVWEHVFDDSAVVVLRDNVTKNTYYGKVCAYSDNSDNREIYFENVYVFDEKSNPLYTAEKLYLSRAHNEFTIEIQDDSIGNKGEKNNESS